jgi:spore coat protein U-like protein
MAATVTGNVPVTSAVVAKCTISIAGASWGSKPGLTDNWEWNSAGLNTTCTKGAVYTVTIDQGANANTGSTCNAPVRRMKGDLGGFIAYTIEQPSNGNPTWGCGSANTPSFTATTGLTPNYVPATIFANPGQDAPADDYSDTLTATVTF